MVTYSYLLITTNFMGNAMDYYSYATVIYRPTAGLFTDFVGKSQSLLMVQTFKDLGPRAKSRNSFMPRSAMAHSSK
jgi:hypothetical protein